MTTYALPILTAIIVWWFSTGLILWLGRRDERLHKTIMLGATGFAALSLVAINLSADMTSMIGAYVAFAAAIALWGWHELAFIFGMITGPRRTDCPKSQSGLERFKSAVETLLYHEIGLLMTGLVIGLMTLSAMNKIALLTFSVLWVMRVSAKLNLFFGVPKVAIDMMPARLRYLASYFRQGTISVFFPVSVTAAMLGFGGMIAVLMTIVPPVEPFVAEGAFVGLILCTTLLALAIFEHWCLILPFDETALWASWFSKEPKTRVHNVGNAREPMPPAERKTLVMNADRLLVRDGLGA